MDIEKKRRESQIITTYVTQMAKMIYDLGVSNELYHYRGLVAEFYEGFRISALKLLNVIESENKIIREEIGMEARKKLKLI